MIGFVVVLGAIFIRVVFVTVIVKNDAGISDLTAWCSEIDLEVVKRAVIYEIYLLRVIMMN